MSIDAGNNRIEANYSSGSSGFRLNNDGSVEFNNGTFRGELTGATINIGSGNSVFKVDSDGDMYLGNSSQGSAPFAVTKEPLISTKYITGTAIIVSKEIFFVNWTLVLPDDRYLHINVV